MLRAALNLFEQGARRSGRTTRMIEALRNGDTIICASGAYAGELTRLIGRERPELISVRVFVCETFEDAYRRTRGAGRVILDHEWVRVFYHRALDQAERELADLTFYNAPAGDQHRDKLQERFEEWPAAFPGGLR